jgi:tetratricopeptide (TPR) repeat protein
MSKKITKQTKSITGKALVIGAMLVMAFPLVVHAQDKIYKTDNKIIEAIVLYISDSQVEYKNFSNPLGSTFTIPRKQVKMIIYQNGKKIVFEQPAQEPLKQKPAPAPVQKKTATASTTVQQKAGQVPPPVQQKPVPVPPTVLAPAEYSVVSHENARSLLLGESINSAIVVYAQLVTKDNENPSLGSEYAYTLALGGLYDAALARLDRVWNLEVDNTDPKYFASQVFTLMGFSRLTGEFHREQDINTVPAWIAVKAPALAQKYKRSKPRAVTGNREELVNDFKRANSLAAQNANLQSIGLFEEITTKYPNEFLPYVGYSIVLENAGLFAKSADSIESALSVIGTSPEQAEARRFLEKRLLPLKTMINTASNAPGPTATTGKTADNTSRPLMAYAGGMIYSGYFNINTRLGYFLSDTGNVSANLGFSSSGGGSSFNLGALYYQRYKEVIVAGAGLSCSTGNSTLALFIKISAGFSFMNKEKTSSWDIFVDMQEPLSKDNATSYGLSIGKSFYFGKR